MAHSGLAALRSITQWRQLAPLSALPHINSCPPQLFTIAAAAGRFTSWARLAGDLQLGPPADGATWLTPAEVAEAIWHVQQEHPAAPPTQLPLRPIKQRLEEAPQTGGKVAAALQARGGDPALLYGSIKLVAAMLECGVSFGVVCAPPPPPMPPVPAEGAAGPPPF